LTLPLWINLLGDFRIVQGDEPVTGIENVRLQSLPAYLLHARFGPQPAGGRAPQLLLAITQRSGEAPPDGRLETLLGELRQSRQVTEIELGPLDEAETFSLAVDVAGRALNPFLKPLLYRGSEGNPLFVVEMVRAGQAKGSQWIAKHGWEKARRIWRCRPGYSE
jgi:hypothetical protein